MKSEFDGELYGWKRPIADEPRSHELPLPASTLIFETVNLLFNGINQSAHFPLHRKQG